MTKAAMEIDFIGLEEGDACSTFGRPESSSSRGVHSLSAQLERTGIASAARSATSVGNLLHSSAADTSAGAAAPFTIFYNGTITTFDLPRDKAEAVIKWAEKTSSRVRHMERPNIAFLGGGGQQLQPPPFFSMDKLREDLPMARKRSLQRFLEKRKER